MAASYRPPAPAYALPTATLLGQVLGITAIGFLITAIAAFLFGDISFGMGLAALIAGFVVLMVMGAVRANTGAALALFYLFTALEGIGVAPLLSAYVNLAGDAVVFQAAATTGLGMLVLAMIAFATRFDYRRLAGVAFGALIALLVVGVLSIFSSLLHPEVYSWLTLVVFTLLVLVDFARIRAAGPEQSAVMLATAIYLDALNIFLALVQIFAARRRD